MTSSADPLDDLFGPSTRPEDQHDPKGKVRLRTLPGMRGGAVFSPCGRYRPLLWRRWDREDSRELWAMPFALWIGMNPSTASAEVDDPTIRREVDFTQRAGLSVYVKCNVLDYRSTSPDGLLSAENGPSSATNLDKILWAAEKASMVVLAHGLLPKPLRHHAALLLRELRARAVKPLCLGRTKDGTPRHPLYLSKAAAFEPV